MHIYDEKGDLTDINIIFIFNINANSALRLNAIFISQRIISLKLKY